MKLFSKKIIIFFSLFTLTLCAFLWDFRPFGVRAFDLVSIGIASVFLIYNLKWWRYIRPIEYVFLSVVLLYSVVGFLNYQHISSLFIALYSILFFILHKGYDREISLKIIKFLMIFSLCIFFLQFIFYYSFNHVLDAQTFFGSISRLQHSGLFRPAGLYSEPHTYCVSVLLLILITLGQKSFRVLHYVGCFTMVISLSLWGVIAGLCLPLVMAIWNSSSLKLAVVRYISITLAILLGFTVVYGGILDRKEPFEMIEARILQVFTDASFKERFVTHIPQAPSAKNKMQITENKKETSQKPTHSLLNIIFGNGLSTYPFKTGLALNGYTFILHAFGILGSALIILSGLYYLGKWPLLRVTEKLSLLGGILLLLTSYPMITYAFFWIFLSLLPRESPYLREERNRPIF